MAEKKRPLRIGLDARVFIDSQYSGIPRAVYEILRVWARDYPENEYYLVSSVPIHLDLELPPNWHLVIGPQWMKKQKLWVFFFFRPIVERLKLDVFWGTNYVLPGKVKNTKQVVTVYDFSWARFPWVSGRQNLLRLKLFAGRSCRIADRVVAISKATARDAMKVLQVPREKLTVSYCGGLPDGQIEEIRKGQNIEKNQDIEKDQEFREDQDIEKGQEFRKDQDIEKDQNIGTTGESQEEHHGLTADTPYFLFISTIEPRKNVSTIIRAYEIFRDEGESSEKLVLAGRRGWNCDEIYELARSSRYRDDILMPGFVTDEERTWLLEHASAFLYPSVYEGFGIPVLEAFAYGLPVITARNSSLPEVGGEGAFYIEEATDAAALAGQMQKVLSLTDSQLKTMHSEQEKMLASFSWKKNADEMMKILRKLCSGTRTRG